MIVSDVIFGLYLGIRDQKTSHMTTTGGDRAPSGLN